MKNKKLAIAIAILIFIVLITFIYVTISKKDPKYQTADGSLDLDAIQNDLGVPVEPSPEGALKEVNLSAEDGIIKPHVLGHAEVAIYSNENGEPWKLKKGDKLKFHVYVDTEYYKHVGQLYFGALKPGESFLVDHLDTENGGDSVKSEKSFEYVASEAGEYHFYLFRGSTEPIVVKWIAVD